MTESPLVDSSFAVPVFSLGDDPITYLNKAMAFLIVVASSRIPSTNNQLRASSNLRNQATIQDGRVTMQQVQGRQCQSYSGTGYKGNATSSEGNNASGQMIQQMVKWLKDKPISVGVKRLNTGDSSTLVKANLLRPFIQAKDSRKASRKVPREIGQEHVVVLGEEVWIFLPELIFTFPRKLRTPPRVPSNLDNWDTALPLLFDFAIHMFSIGSSNKMKLVGHPLGSLI
ncbi:hypothetical protein Tco_1237156 [Tanacetum coccineum]